MGSQSSTLSLESTTKNYCIKATWVIVCHHLPMVEEVIKAIVPVVTIRGETTEEEEVITAALDSPVEDIMIQDTILTLGEEVVDTQENVIVEEVDTQEEEIVEDAPEVEEMVEVDVVVEIK